MIPKDLKATRRPLSSSCLGLPYRILNISHKKELLRGLGVPKNMIPKDLKAKALGTCSSIASASEMDPPQETCDDLRL